MRSEGQGAKEFKRKGRKGRHAKDTKKKLCAFCVFFFPASLAFKSSLTILYQKCGRSLLYVVVRSSGWTRVSPTVVIKLVSPIQRGMMCR